MPPISAFTFCARLRHECSGNIAGFANHQVTQNSLTRAAVALTVIEHQGEAALIVTKRARGLKVHSGQWALPGGRIDDGETTTQAALRELHEEVNLRLTEKAVLGLLDDYVTRSGYVITPVVVWADENIQNLNPNPDEVASIHAFSFAELTRDDSPNLESIAESDRQVLSMNFSDDRIYAPTAAMLYQFREVCILGKSTRVAHYDQPVFAWK